MREWQVGDPIGDGNDIGVPDTKYLNYLKNNDYDAPIRNNNVKQSDIKKSDMYQDEALKLIEQKKFYDALTFINAAINYNPNDETNWNVKGIILLYIFRDNDKDVAFEAYHCFNKALGLNPYDKVIKNNKAIFLTDWAFELYPSPEATKRVNEALAIFEDKTCATYAVASYIKADILNKNGEYDEALKYVNKALELRPNDEDVQKLKQEILRKRLPD
jgi:Flp pilus assembly protein TadD